ncbi:nitroreductase family protein [Cellulomonas sp. NPDC057328]|uniref:nitroreductase family protein n=1 Tax=Cellulomonas sp. NPDC057328 TaxID=3346101 RepID=UPI0036276B9C
MSARHDVTDDDLRRWVRAAGRAPSAHNTQPWAVRVVDGRIEVAVVPDRVLCAGDPSFRDLLLSLGAWVESAAVVAAADGHGLAVEPTPHLDRLEDMPVRGAADPAAPVLVLRPAGTPEPTALTPADVRDRRVHRGTLLPAPDLRASLPPLPAGLRLLQVDDPAMTRLVRLGSAWTASRRAVAAELVRWLRLSPEHPRYTRDGMTDRMLLLPPWLARVAAPLTRRPALHDRALAVAGLVGRAVEAVDRTRPLPPPPAPGAPLAGPQHLVLVAGTPGVHSATETMDARLGLPPADVVDAGRVLQRTWLHAHRAGLAVAPHSEVVDSPHAVAGLRRRLGLRRSAVALAVFSVGRPGTPAPRSPRLTDAAAPAR